MAHVPHVYVAGPWAGDVIYLDDRARHHLGRVLRLRPDAPVSYTDGAGTTGDGRFTGDAIRRGAERHPAPPSPPITMWAPPPRRPERARFLVEKLAELGVDRLLWAGARFGEGRPPRSEKVLAWTISALEQSRGDRLLDVGVAGDAVRADVRIAAHPDGEPFGAVLPLIADAGSVDLLVGPEGGFAPGELPEGVRTVTLGGRILRTETAAVVVSALVVAHRWGVMGQWTPG